MQMEGKRARLDGMHRAERARLCPALRAGSREIDPPHCPVMTGAPPLPSVHLRRVWQEVVRDPAVSQGGPVPWDGSCLLQITLARPAMTRDFQSCRRTS